MPPARRIRIRAGFVVSRVHRFRVIDEESGADLGPFVSSRLAFQVGETVGRNPDDRLMIVRVVEAEPQDSFHAYLVVRQM